MGTFTSLRLIPIRFKQFIVLKKLFKSKFCKYFFIFVKKQNKSGLNIIYPYTSYNLLKKRKSPYHSKYKLACGSFIWFKCKYKERYIKRAMKGQFFKFNFKVRRRAGIFLSMYWQKYKKIKYLFNKNNFITKSKLFKIKRWFYHEKVNNIKKINKLMIRNLYKKIRYSTIYLMHFNKLFKINKKKKWYFLFKKKKEKKKFKINGWTEYYTFWKKKILNRKHKKLLKKYIYKLNFNSYIYDNFYKLLYNQFINYHNFLLEYKIKNNIYFIIYNIPFLEIISQLNTLIKDRLIFINKLPNLVLFKKYYL
jgi:hypothetical protein